MKADFLAQKLHITLESLERGGIEVLELVSDNNAVINAAYCILQRNYGICENEPVVLPSKNPHCKSKSKSYSLNSSERPLFLNHDYVHLIKV